MSVRWAPSRVTGVARLLLLLLLVGGVACRPSGHPPQRLTVMAAASLYDAMAQLEPLFGRSHPGVQVAIITAGTQQLAAQLRHGARADLFASADPQQLHALQREGLLGPETWFAGNTVVVAVAAHARQVVTSLEHLPRAERIVLGTPGSPIGRYSDEVLRQAGERYGGAFVRQVQERVVSREANVRQVLAKVRMGEADAALVYRSDTLQQAGVHTVELPDAIQPDVRYPVATVAATAVPQLADAWVALMMRAEGQAILQRAGLRPIAPPQQVK